MRGTGPAFRRWCRRASRRRAGRAAECRIFIASVTTKAFNLSFTIRNPLTTPISAPIKGMAATADRSRQLDAEARGGFGKHQHRTAGAMPTMDFSDRSNLPVMRTSDFRQGRRRSAADEPRMLTMFACVRKLGLTKPPTITRAISAGRGARSLRPASRWPPADRFASWDGSLPRDNACGLHPSCWLISSIAAVSSRSRQPAGNSLTSSPRNMTKTRSRYAGPRVRRWRAV